MATRSMEVGAAPVAATPDQPGAMARVESLDLIRGFAVMGIVLGNLDAFSSLFLEHQWPSVDGPLTPAEDAAWLFNYVFVDGKLRGLFSVLFGAGMLIFLDRARARGAPALWLQLRRLFWLLLFGLAHLLLFYRSTSRPAAFVSQGPRGQHVVEPVDL